MQFILAAELKTLPEQAVILALGTVTHQAILKACRLKPSSATFAHNAQHLLPERRVLVDSYHTSCYNLQTKGLNKSMFLHVFRSIRRLLDNPDPDKSELKKIN